MTNEAIVPAQSEDPWRAGLDAILAEYTNIFLVVREALNREGGVREQLARAANEAATHVVQARVDAWKQRLLAWATERYADVMPTDRPIAQQLFMRRHRSNLEARVDRHLQQFVNAMGATQRALSVYVQWYDENISAGALIAKGVRSFIAGLTFDVDGLIDTVAGSANTVQSGTAAEQQLQHALSQAAQTSDTTRTAIDKELVTWWNEEVRPDPEILGRGGFRKTALADALEGLLITSAATLVLLLLHWLVVGIFIRDGLVSSGIGTLITSAHPLWIYIVGGIICVLMALLAGRSWLGKFGLTALFLVGLHVETQVVGWGMLAWLGKSPQEAAANATPSASAPVAPLPNPLAGRWSSQSGLTLDASVRGDGQVALRIVEPGKLASAGYRASDVYATLKPSAGGGYAVEYKFRPTPPAGLAYDNAAADTCQEVVSDVRGKPLTASLDGDKLTVQLARIDVAPTSFKLRGVKIVECKQLNMTSTSVIELVLDRAAAPSTTTSRAISVEDLPTVGRTAPVVQPAATQNALPPTGTTGPSADGPAPSPPSQPPVGPSTGSASNALAPNESPLACEMRCQSTCSAAPDSGACLQGCRQRECK